VRTRFLPIFFGVVFALTLFFAVAAGAQVQVQELQQQQVPDNQQQILEVRQQQVLDNQGQAVAVQQQQVGVQSHRGCPGSHTEHTIKNSPQRRVVPADIEGGAVRITYEVTNAPNANDELEIELRDEDGDIVFLETVRGTTSNRQQIRVETDPGRHELKVEADPDVDYFVKLEDCTNVDANNDGGDGGGDGDGDGDGGTGDGGTGDGTTDDTADTTQDTTTTDTTTTDTTNDALETTTADDANLNAELNRPDADNFRCDFFLRAVRDDRGALRDQYVGDELIVQRFEQCLSEDVLADTFPDRQLPFTGGMSLLFLGAIGLAAIVAGFLVLRAVTRRGT
jgi:hypothetical protein